MNRSRLGRLAAMLIAALLGLGALRLLGAAGRPGAGADLAAPAEPPPSAATTTAQVTTTAPADTRVRGQVAPELAGTLLYFGGERPRVVDLGARTVAPVLSEPPGPPALVLRQGATPVLVHGRDVLILPERPGTGPARRLPAAAVPRSPPGAALVEYWVLRATSPDEVHLVSFDRAAPDRLAVRRVPLRGGPPRMVSVFAPGVEPVAMLDGSVLLRAPGGGLELASMPGLRRQARLGEARLLDAHRGRLAFVDGGGRLHLYDLATRNDRIVPRPRHVFRWEAFAGANDTCCQRQAAFSPDGRTLAVLSTMDRGTLAGITLVDTVTLAASELAGSVGPFPTGCLPCLSWRPDGRWLFFMTGQQSPAVVGAWRRGDRGAGRIIAPLGGGGAPTGLVAAGG